MMLSFGFNMRNTLRIILVLAVVIYLFDAGVEAGKSRKKHNKNRRSKRGRDERRKRQNISGDNEEIQKIEIDDDSFIRLVEAQQKLARSHKIKVEKPVVEDDHHININTDDIQSTLVKKYLENKRKNSLKIPIDEGVTVLPVVHAELNFFTKRENANHIREPPTSVTIEGFNAAQLGLVEIHKSKGKYGLHSSSERVFGKVVHISDAGRANSHFGCGNAIANIKDIPEEPQPWVALIERGHCSFFTKIKLAERNNASAVIIYDNKHEEVPKMNTIGTNIVSVMISKHDGLKVAKIADSEVEILVNIALDMNPDAATVPETATVGMKAQVIQEAVAQKLRDDGRNAAMRNCNGVIMTTLLTMLLAIFLQNMTSS